MNTSFFVLLFFSMFMSTCKAADANDSNKPDTVITSEENNTTVQNNNKKLSKRQERKNRTKKTFTFNVANKPLVDLINELAGEKQLNIILPQGAQAITAKVTYQLKEKFTVDEAWSRLLNIIALLNYTIRPEAGNMLSIVKNDGPNLAREPFRLFIDAPLESLPATQEVIKTIFYLANLSIKVSGNDILLLLKDMLSPSADIKIDIKTNAIILTDKSVNIKSVMKIIHELDQGGIRDSIEVLPLYYASAQVIDDLFNKQLLTPNQAVLAGQGSSSPLFFPKNTKILALDRTNSLVIMGTPHGIDTVKDFIVKYIDRPLESGKSILHVYELKYLNAQQFAPILQQIVTPGLGQQTQTTGKVAGNVQQYFKDVIVQAELTRRTELIQPTQPGGTPTGSAQPISEGTQLGGNRLIVAARKKDWLRIKKLIEDLDKPQPQVALEVLIVDLTAEKDKTVASQIRDKTGMKDSLSPHVDFQVANIGQPIIRTGTNAADQFGNPIVGFTPNGLMANLLQFFPDGVTNLANNTTPGSFLVSINDGVTGVWGLFQILNQFINTTILAQPFVVTANHQQTTLTIQEERLLPGDADTSNTAVGIKFETVVAGLTVDILPHISLTNNVNLQITVNLNQFDSNTSNNRNTRVVQTSANVGNGQILAIGGLTRHNNSITVSQVPLLGSIPIIGWLFKGEQKVVIKNNLMILICPTIIEPRLQGGTDCYTEKKLDYAQGDLDDHLNFENLRDPITRWFFKPQPNFGYDVIKDYRHYAEHKEDEKTDYYFNAVRPNIRKALAYDDQSSTDAENIRQLVMNEENPLLNVNQRES